MRQQQLLHDTYQNPKPRLTLTSNVNRISKRVEVLLSDKHLKIVTSGSRTS